MSLRESICLQSWKGGGGEGGNYSAGVKFDVHNSVSGRWDDEMGRDGDVLCCLGPKCSACFTTHSSTWDYGVLEGWE
jgi:hypothetical protein